MSVADGVALRAAVAADLPRVRALLEEAGLPTDGVAPGGFRIVVADARGEVVGAAGLERHGPDGLLRSVVVAPAWRGRGVAGALVERVLAEAGRADGVTVYLLTTTAAAFFTRFGFRAVPRERVAPGIRGSAEFRSLCPASAVVMAREAAAQAAQRGPRPG